ncbi:MAG: NAD-dependent protein deacylase [Oscillospiraceae bacterium]|nr:NAD-dependent protein deacylase [Oscillospiraceae bacterium]
METINKLQEIVQSSQNIVFFGGAGVSTESGIPDFRSQDGLYRQKYTYPPEVMLSYSFFQENPREFYRFYRDKLVHVCVKPNKAHIVLARLEDIGKLKAVITQNIDGLHSAAGSQNVLELHGTSARNYCIDCKVEYPGEVIWKTDDIPYCQCGGMVRPDIVLYEEGLDEELLYKATHHIKQADTLIVGGTSLNVYPAAGLLTHYCGNRLVLINKSETPYDGHADLIIRAPIGETLGAIASMPAE